LFLLEDPAVWCCVKRGFWINARTLHEASILWRVTQTAVTLKTGLQSVPSIDAQIYKRDESEHGTGKFRTTDMAIGIHMLV
jgi:hypothetical protein